MENKVITKVPISIVADSESELTLLCVRNNTINDKMFDYTVVYQRDDKKLVAWFRADIESYIPLDAQRQLGVDDAR